MSNLEDHMAEQARITAACEAGDCDHPECLRRLDSATDLDRAVEIIVDLKELLRVYVCGEDRHETRGQAIETIRRAQRWLRN